MDEDLIKAINKNFTNIKNMLRDFEKRLEILESQNNSAEFEAEKVEETEKVIIEEI